MNKEIDLLDVYKPVEAGIPTPRSLAKKLPTGIAGKLVMGISVSMAGNLILHSKSIWKGVTYLAASIAVLGDKDVQKFRNGVEGIVQKAEKLPGVSGAEVDEKDKEGRKTGDKDADENGEEAKPRSTGFLDGLKVRAAEPAKKAMKKVEDAKDVGVEKADAIKDSLDKLGQRGGASNAPQEGGGFVPGGMMGGGIREADGETPSFGNRMLDGVMGTPESRAAAEASERATLVAQAEQLGLEPEEWWTLEKLRVDVKAAAVEQKGEKQAAFLEWWARNSPSNGKCIYCRTPMRVRPKGDGYVGCPNVRCGQNFKAHQARAMGGQSPPLMYPAAFNVEWNRRCAQKAAAVRKGDAK